MLREDIMDIVGKLSELPIIVSLSTNGLLLDETLLKELKKRGLKLAVLSDFPVGKKLEYFKLANLFDYALSSESTGYLKPNPEPFKALASTIGFPPAEILFIGNNLRYDIAGASGTGMKTAYIGMKRDEKICADIKFLWYKELRSVLGEEQWNSR